MAKEKKKPGKYDTTLKVNATFEQLIAASVQNINLRPIPRAEIEESRTDIMRFQLPKDYLNKDSLKYFREPALRELFINLFWKQPDNVVGVLDKAVEQSGNSPRFKQIKETVLALWVKDGKLVFKKS